MSTTRYTWEEFPETGMARFETPARGVLDNWRVNSVLIEKELIDSRGDWNTLNDRLNNIIAGTTKTVSTGYYQAANGDVLMVSRGAVITMPAEPVVGSTVTFIVGGRWDWDSIKIMSSTHKINGLAQGTPMHVNDLDGFTMVYTGPDFGWGNVSTTEGIYVSGGSSYTQAYDYPYEEDEGWTEPWKYQAGIFNPTLSYDPENDYSFTTIGDFAINAASACNWYNKHDGYMYAAGIFYVINSGGFQNRSCRRIYRAHYTTPASWSQLGWGDRLVDEPHVYVDGSYVYLIGGQCRVTSNPDEYILIIGHETGQVKFVQYAHLSNLGTQKWTTIDNVLPYGISQGASIRIGDYFYIFGGEKNSGATDQIIRCPVDDLITPSSWEIIPDTLPREIKELTGIKHGSKIYLYGGKNTDNGSSEMWSADISDLSDWTYHGTTPELWGNSSIMVYNDTITAYHATAAAACRKSWTASLSDPFNFSMTHVYAEPVYDASWKTPTFVMDDYVLDIWGEELKYTDGT
jgi:hypothetical protein